MFLFECAVHRQGWADYFIELVSTGAMMYIMVLGGGGCFKDGTGDVYRSYQFNTLPHLHVNTCQR